MLDIQREADRIAAQSEVRAVIGEGMRDVMEDLTFDQYANMTKQTLIACTSCLGIMECFLDYYLDELITVDDILRMVNDALAERKLAD